MAVLGTVLSAFLSFERQDKAVFLGPGISGGHAFCDYPAIRGPSKNLGDGGSLGEGQRLQLSVRGPVSPQGRVWTTHSFQLCPSLDCPLHQFPCPIKGRLSLDDP